MIQASKTDIIVTVLDMYGNYKGVMQLDGSTDHQKGDTVRLPFMNGQYKVESQEENRITVRLMP